MPVYALNIGDEADIDVGEDDDPVLIFDINGDGTVNDIEVNLLKRKLAGWNVPYIFENWDVNGDGNFDDKDPDILAKYLAGWNVFLAL